jgi:fused signal recognition particle receptor
MFDSLRKKFTGWFGKKEEPKEEKPVEKEEKKARKKAKPVEKKVSQKEKKETKKPSQKKAVKEEKPAEVVEEKPASIEQELQKKASEIKEEVPQEFSTGKLQFEPSIKEIKEKLKEETLKEKIEEKPVEKKGFFQKIKEKFAEKKPEEAKEEPKKTEEPEQKIQPEVKEKISEVEPAKEEPEEEGFFSKLKKKLSTSELKQSEFNEIFEDLEIILLENNVALQVVDKIKESLSKSLVGVSVKKENVEDKIKESLKEAILNVLIEGESLLDKIKSSNKEFTILFFGINGTGKTTTIAKLAYLLKKNNISCVLGAADTFRAASIEQLEKHAIKVGVPIVKGEYGKDPAAVAFDTIQYAKKHKIKVVLIDTAGRMYTQGNLMREMEKIVRVANADLKIFVGESITGNDATEQAKSFHESINIDGIILSKADVDEKAGTILSVSYVTGKPIYFLGVGQEYKDLKEFKKEDVLQGLGLE